MNTKLKQQSQKRPTKRKILPVSEPSQALKATELFHRWESSIERLKGRALTSSSEAVEAIINEVVDSESSPDAEEAKELLRLLFESDPHLMDTIERLLVRGEYS